MPFTKHIIEPINISQCPLPSGEPNELECLSNLTLANVIRQLSSLGQHAGRIFDELIQDAVRINSRSLVLNARIDNLKSKCAQLDLQNEDVSVDDLRTKKQFKSSVKIDQQVVSRRTMPDSIRILYNNADPPPALDKLNPYRTDGKDCMKFYTDPEFFFNIWCNELIKDNETRKNEKKKRKTRGGGDQKNIKSPMIQPAVGQPYMDETAQLTNTTKQLIYNESLRNNNGNPAILLQQQQQQIEQYRQQQLLLLKQQSQQQQHIYSSNNNTNNQIVGNNYYINNDQQQANNTNPDSSLPPPPPLIQNQNFEVYAEANRYNNGNRNTKLTIQQAKQQQQMLGGQERPLLPPPPIPADNQISDLQQIQQQIIRKFDVGVNMARDSLDAAAAAVNNDLPPPPSPPQLDFSGNVSKGVANVAGLAQTMSHLLLTQQKQAILAVNELTDSCHDMLPLPPPPEDLTNKASVYNNHHHGYHQQTQQQHSSLPPPPPLPPLVEPDTTSSSNSSLSPSHPPTGQSTTMKNSTSGQQQPQRSFLDDINKGRFVLKPTQKENLEERKKAGLSGTGGMSNGVGGVGNEETIQPFVNNSDVAAIIDFVRKFRTHVQDSSDDEENSDWDE